MKVDGMPPQSAAVSWPFFTPSPQLAAAQVLLAGKGGQCAAGACVANCKDGVKDADETDIDCGGPSCGACGTGAHCAVGSDCASKVCDGGLCAAAACTDGVKNGDETDVDCGGSCKPCGPTMACRHDQDCAGKLCEGRKCTADCTDGVKNGDESDVDCGGSCKKQCVVGKACGSADDCASGACDETTKTRVADGCVDHQKAGDETDVDCGGAVCGPCALAQGCKVDGDCASGSCDADAHVCVADACADHHQDGDETASDCGGSCAAKCAVDQGCKLDVDCASGACDSEPTSARPTAAPTITRTATRPRRIAAALALRNARSGRPARSTAPARAAPATRCR